MDVAARRTAVVVVASLVAAACLLAAGGHSGCPFQESRPVRVFVEGLLAFLDGGGLWWRMAAHSDAPPSEGPSGVLYAIPRRITDRQPYVASRAEYDRMCEAAASPQDGGDAFWLGQAGRLLSWAVEPTVGFGGNFAEGRTTYFADGQLNVAYNCIDRHDPTATALIWEPDEPPARDGRSHEGRPARRRVTYGELGVQVSKLAHYLTRECGISAGDTVAIYMPMVVEAVVAMLACARIGAMHNVVFAGFSSASLADRLADSHARILITADEGIRGGRVVPLKAMADAAAAVHRLERMIVFQRTGNASVAMQGGRDVFWGEALADMPEAFEAPAFGAEQPLFMLYTSGSTGKPKGLVHTSGGYLTYAAATFKHSFEVHPSKGDIYACMADIGWITGHSYIVYGPLALGATSVLFESVPTYPDASRYWRLVEELGITHLYTAPTVVRALKKFGDAPVEAYDRSSLLVLASVGEPINPEAWLWYHGVVGGGRCAVVDTYWQTETGGHVVTAFPGAHPTKAGSATLPFPGIVISILDGESGAVLGDGGSGAASGVLAISRPWPGIARTIFGDHTKYVETYFRPYPGHYFSGDRVDRDADGYYWIRGRVDDVINVSGHRLSTAEIEAALGRDEACIEAAVLGKPDDITGQSIWAFCIVRDAVLAGGAAGDVEQRLIATVRSAIGPFAAPRRVILVSDLPKTRSGKIMRRIIRKTLEGISEASALGDISTLNNPAVVGELIRAIHGGA